MNELREGGKKRMRETNGRRNSPPDVQQQGRGWANLPFVASMLERLDMGGQPRVQQFTNGPPAIGGMGEQSVHPADNSFSRPELVSDQLFRNAGRRIRARTSGPRDPDASQLWGNAIEQIGQGWLGGPFPYDGDGQLLTGEGPLEVNPAFRFGAHLGGASCGRRAT